MIREDILDEFYLLPELNSHEVSAISACLPLFIGVNVFLNRPKDLPPSPELIQKSSKSGWPYEWTADYHLTQNGISWGYRRGDVRYCHIEYEIRRQSAEIIFNRDNPRRVDIRSIVVDRLSQLGIGVHNSPGWWKGV